VAGIAGPEGSGIFADSGTIAGVVGTEETGVVEDEGGGGGGAEAAGEAVSEARGASGVSGVAEAKANDAEKSEESVMTQKDIEALPSILRRWQVEQILGLNSEAVRQLRLADPSIATRLPGQTEWRFYKVKILALAGVRA
jgi:hypothetical protein